MTVLLASGLSRRPVPRAFREAFPIGTVNDELRRRAGDQGLIHVAENHAPIENGDDGAALSAGSPRCR